MAECLLEKEIVTERAKSSSNVETAKSNINNENFDITKSDDFTRKATFNFYKDVTSWLKSSKKWIASDWHKTDSGMIRKLRCSTNPVDAEIQRCPASAYLFYNKQSNCYEFFESKKKHNHDSNYKMKFGISSTTRKAIKELNDKGVTFPILIIQILKMQSANNPHIVVPTKTQLNKYLDYKLQRGDRTSKNMINHDSNNEFSNEYENSESREKHEAIRRIAEEIKNSVNTETVMCSNNQTKNDQVKNKQGDFQFDMDLLQNDEQVDR